MANTYKNIVITPNRDTPGNTYPSIKFSGGDGTSNTDITMNVYTTANGTLSFEGSAGQLFSITNDLTNSIFSVNDVSGIPLVDVNANGNITLAGYGGKVGIGTLNPNYSLEVVGTTKSTTIQVGPTSWANSSNTALVSGGFFVTSWSIGTGSGTITPNAANGNYQFVTNNGAFTIAAPGTDCAIDLLVTNGASAGAITLTGFTIGTFVGSTYGTTNGYKFILSIRRINGTSTFSWYALQ